MSEIEIVVVGASAGGVEALIEFVRSLKPGIQAAVFVVLHTPSYRRSTLPQILNRYSPLKAEHASDKTKIEPGNIYIAPPDRHMVIEDSTIRLDPGPRINRFRPSIEPLFRSAAKVYGPKVAGVLLSGTLDDGVTGLITIKQQGGLTFVQDPREAAFPTLPANAITSAEIDYVLPAAEISRVISGFTTQETEERPGGVEMVLPDSEKEIIQQDMQAFEDGKNIGDKSVIVCPDCGGPLWEFEDRGVLHYRCHTGHEFSQDGLYYSQAEELETALWHAVRIMRERVRYCRRLEKRAADLGQGRLHDYYKQQAQMMERNAEVIEELITKGNDVLPNQDQEDLSIG